MSPTGEYLAPGVPTDAQPGEAYPGSVNGIPVSDILAELEALCGHERMARSRRQTDFLRYSVNAVLRGEGDQLKEYTLAVDAFGKPADFDPKLDSSVRSEATRIRAKLDEFYAGDFAAHPVRILLPRGSYAVVFEATHPDSSHPSLTHPSLTHPSLTHPSVTHPPAGPAQLASRQGRPGFLKPVLGIALVAVVLLPGIRFWSRSAAPPAGIQVSRFDNFSDDRRFPMISRDGKVVVFSQAQGLQQYLYVSRQGAAPVALNQQGEQAAWSPDGTQLAFRSSRDGGGLFLLQLATNTVRKISAEGFHPSWAPDGSRIVYSTESFLRPEERLTTSGVLSILNLKTLVSRQLTTLALVGDAIQPAWSPDGRWIAFWSIDDAGNRDVYVIPADGGRPVRITEPEPLDWSPAWSPDGRVYWASNKGGATNLWRVGIGHDGHPSGTPEQVPLPATYAGFFSFSRDGQLLYANARPLSSVFTSSLDSGSPGSAGLAASPPVRLTPETLRVRRPAPSPDGQYFAAFVLDPQEDLVVFRRDGTGMRKLTNDAFRDRGPAWSPDGTRIAFVSNRGGDYQIWSIRPDGEGLAPLVTNPKGAFVPVWSPNSRRIAWYERGFRALVTPAPSNSNEHSPPLSPNVPFIPNSWSSSGREILGESSPSAVDSDGMLASWSLDTGTLHSFGVLGRGPHWLEENKRLLFLREGGLFVRDVEKQSEVRLLTLPGSVSRRFEYFRPSRTLFFEIRESRAEFWLASLH